MKAIWASLAVGCVLLGCTEVGATPMATVLFGCAATSAITALGMSIDEVIALLKKK